MENSNLARNFHGEVFFSSPRRKARYTSEELSQVFADIERAEHDAYFHFFTYRPLGLYLAQNLHNHFTLTDEITEEINSSLFAIEQSYFYEDRIDRQKFINMLVPNFRLLDAPRDWARFVVNTIARPSKLNALERFAGDSMLEDQDYLTWAHQCNVLWRRVLKLKNAFVEDNRGLVGTLVKRHFGHALNSSCTMRDLQQEGVFGLIRAIDKFDHTKNLKFSTYANWWIRHCIVRAVQDKEKMVRIPVHVADKTLRIRQAQSKYYQKYGEWPTSEHLQKETSMDKRTIDEYLAGHVTVFSLDAKLNTEDGDEGADFNRFLADENAVDPVDVLADKEKSQILAKAMKVLDPRELIIIKMRFGFEKGPNDDFTYTLNEIGTKYKLSRERIRQLEYQALTKLRKAIGNKAANLI